MYATSEDTSHEPNPSLIATFLARTAARGESPDFLWRPRDSGQFIVVVVGLRALFGDQRLQPAMPCPTMRLRLKERPRRARAHLCVTRILHETLPFKAVITASTAIIILGI